MAEGAWRAWPRPAEPVAKVALRFGSDVDRDALGNISAGARVGDSLFVAGDEHAHLDRLTVGDDGCDGYWCFDLADLLPLADPEGEADLEGLAADDGWLWIVGSHARTRAKPEKMEGERIDLSALADLKDTRSRCLLARVPLVPEDGGWRPVREDGERRAGMLRQKRRRNALAKALRRDPLLRPFTKVPAKEGGVDVEGIAACGDRVALGMRGPVIAGHALLVELTVRAKRSGRLTLAGEPVLRLLTMEGLGVRDLKRVGRDLLILAGPTTGLDGPCALYRWRGWADDPPRDPRVVRLHRPERVLDLPFGRGEDHAEGLALWGEERVLVINDSPAKGRLAGEGVIVADVFEVG